MSLAYIPISETEFTIINLEDAPLVLEAGLKWSATSRGYAVSRPGKYKRVSLHRLITGAPVGLEVDHKNHDRLDNRRDNLRVVTNTLNQANKKKMSGWGKDTSPFKGLSAHPRGWRLFFKSEYIGFYKQPEIGALVYNHLVYLEWGEHSLLNELVFNGSDMALISES